MKGGTPIGYNWGTMDIDFRRKLRESGPYSNDVRDDVLLRLTKPIDANVYLQHGGDNPNLENTMDLEFPRPDVGHEVFPKELTGQTIATGK